MVLEEPRKSIRILPQMASEKKVMQEKRITLAGFTAEEKRARQRKLCRIWYQKNREQQIAYYREYYKKHKHEIKVRQCLKQ